MGYYKIIIHILDSLYGLKYTALWHITLIYRLVVI